MRFSQRIGKTRVQTAFQIDSMDGALRNRLWSVIYAYVFKDRDDSVSLSSNRLDHLFFNLWDSLFREPIDNIPTTSWEAIKNLRERFFSAEWFEVYDILEVLIGSTLPFLQPKHLVETLNTVLESEMSGFRILDGLLAPITAESETEAISKAIEDTRKGHLIGANTHLENALAKLSDRKQPDYRNSIKESISAVESVAKLIAGKDKATLGDALNVIEAKVEMHKSLKNAFSNMYGYTSDEQGIRHALLDAPQVDFDDAKLMLITCSAFISFLLGKCAKAGISFQANPT